MPLPPELLVGIETADDAAVYQLNDEQALIATTDFFMPIVDDPYDFGRIAATNAISDVYAMGGRPIMALALVGMPVNVLSHRDDRRASSKAANRSAARPASRSPAATPSTRSSRSTASWRSGLVHPERVKRNAERKPGDVLVLGKPLGVGVLVGSAEEGRADAAGYAADDRDHHPAQHARARTGCAGRRARADRRDRLRPGGPCARDGASARALTCASDWSQVPAAAGRRELASAGHGHRGLGPQLGKATAPTVELARRVRSGGRRRLLTDPQTSGGLLASCAPDTVEEVMSGIPPSWVRRCGSDRRDAGRCRYCSIGCGLGSCAAKVRATRQSVSGQAAASF